MQGTIRVLLVDDDPEIRELTTRSLESYHIDVVAVANGEEMFALFRKGEVFDLILLDIMLPGEDGLALCKKVRTPDKPNTHIPIIFLSALGDTVDRVLGLEMGGDDYIAKPFQTRELVARIRALLRRSLRVQQKSAQSCAPNSAQNERRDNATVSFGEWHLHTLERNLEDEDGVVVPLSTMEFRLLSLFLSHPNMVLTRERILDHMCGQGQDIYDRSIDVQVSRLRGKLRDESRAPRLIRTLRGTGYMFIGQLA